MKKSCPYIKLNNGNEIPAIGMGTYELADNIKDMQVIVDSAIEIGYRLFDTAALYGVEDILGEALRNNGIPREELFISSKLKNGHHRYEDALAEFDKSMKALGVDYLDMYLIHYPCPEHGLFKEAWKALEHLYKEGYVKNIGVSNFYIEHLEALLPSCEIIPVIDQFECNPYITMRPLREYLKEKGIQPEAWFSLGGPAVKSIAVDNPDLNLMTDPVVASIAKKYGKSQAQILLRWAAQSGIIVIPKSANPVRMRENFSIFEFTMSDEDMRRLDDLNLDHHTYNWLAGDVCNEYWE